MGLIRDALTPVVSDPGPPGPQSLRLGARGPLDRWSLGIIGVVALVLLSRASHLAPSMSDTWYHVGVAHQIMKTGEIPGWDDWNYAPLGRPHLYPPLLHLILAFLGNLTGSILTAGKLCAALFYPAALLTAWYAARRLIGPSAALLTVLLMLTDMFHFVIMESYIAGCLVNILVPLLMVGVLSRRAWWSVLLMTLIFYTHLGFAPCVAAGLLLFGFKYRGYLRLVLKVVGISLVFYVPWLSHVLGNLEWLGVLKQGGMPGGLVEKLLSLQALNLVVLGLGFWGVAIAPRSQPGRMLPGYMLLGFLPILFSYGGRYPMHTLPLWAMLGASAIQGLAPAGCPRRRLWGLSLLPLLPWPALGMMGDKPGPMPITGAHMVLITAFSRGGLLQMGDRNEAYREDCEALAAWLREHTTEDETLYTNTVWVADMVSLLADRRTDFGAWWECSKESAKLYGKHLRDWDTGAVFVHIKLENDAGSVLWQTPGMPGVDRRLSIGRFEIGIRDPVHLRPTGGTVRGWKPLGVAGSASSVRETTRHLVWLFPGGEGRMAYISAPVDSEADGIVMRVTASEMTGDLVLGAKLADGTDLRWPVSIPEGGKPYGIRALFRRMVDEAGRAHPGGVVREVYLCKPADKRVGKGKRKQWCVEVTGIELLRETRGVHAD